MLNSSTFTKNMAVFLALLLLLSSCVSTTTIMSRPPGAKVFINNEYVGETPVSYSDTKIVGSLNYVSLEKEGYENLETSFSRTEEADIGAIIGGIFIWIPFLWVMKYKPKRTYELIPLSESPLMPRNPAAPQTFENQVNQNTSLKPKTEQLRELKKLLDEGILTQEEFEVEKKKILEQQ